MLKPMNIHESGPIGRRQQQTSDLCEIIKIVRNLSIKSEILVEAAGVEPASENVTGQETTCLFTFMPQAFAAIADGSPGTFAAHAQNGQETLAASL
jgi:hypothetical protein